MDANRRMGIFEEKMQMETSDNFQKLEWKKKKKWNEKGMKRITAIEKKEIKKKRRIKVKLKTNKGLQEGIFIFLICY